MLSIIKRYIAPDIVATVPEDYLPQNYPWCFVISAGALSQRYHLAGALSLVTNKQGERSLRIIYGMFSDSWLKKNMRDDYPLTFWAARILNSVPGDEGAEKDRRYLKQWTKVLRRAYSPFWEYVHTPAWRFKNQSQMLLREGSQEDYRIGDEDGVENMPWREWPDCLQQEASVWLWRQSRYKRILDSQRIPLRRAGAASPDSFN